jgi:hypothetical protein
MTLTRHKEKITIATVATGDASGVDLQALRSVADALTNDWEMVVVAHHLAAEAVITLTREIKQIPDATLHILDMPANDGIARLGALDMAIGDWILLVDPSDLEINALKTMLKHGNEGFEVVIEWPSAKEESSFAYRVMRTLFLWLYRRASSIHIESIQPVTWLYSRAAALHLLSRREAEMLLRTQDIAAAFPGKSIDYKRPRKVRPRSNARNPNPLGRAYRALNFTNSLPLRSIIVLSITSAIFNVGYMGYSLISQLISDNNVPGWTSLSLQISCVFLIISIVLAIMAEHLIEIDRAINKRPCYRVLREVRSPLSKARLDRNVAGLS